MDNEPGKCAQAHRVDRPAYLINSDTISGSIATTVSNLTSNANQINAPVGKVINKTKVINIVQNDLPKQSVCSNHIT